MLIYNNRNATVNYPFLRATPFPAGCIAYVSLGVTQLMSLNQLLSDLAQTVYATIVVSDKDTFFISFSTAFGAACTFQYLSDLLIQSTNERGLTGILQLAHTPQEAFVYTGRWQLVPQILHYSIYPGQLDGRFVMTLLTLRSDFRLLYLANTEILLDKYPASSTYIDYTSFTTGLIGKLKQIESGAVTLNIAGAINSKLIGAKAMLQQASTAYYLYRTPLLLDMDIHLSKLSDKVIKAVNGFSILQLNIVSDDPGIQVKTTEDTSSVTVSVTGVLNIFPGCGGSK